MENILDSKIFAWYKEHKPQLMETEYGPGLKVGVIVKSGNNYYIIYPSEDWIVRNDSDLIIPLRKLLNNKQSFTKIEGDKNGVCIYSLSEEPKIEQKTHFFCMEMLQWMSDDK